MLKNYHGGTPFPDPQDPNKGWKMLANVFWAYQPSVYVNSPNNFGAIWSNDRFGNSNTTTIDVVYRWSDFNTNPGFPVQQNYAPGTWYTEWLMEETPEQARYTASLNLFFVDQEKNPFPDSLVFVPALRRSLRLGQHCPLFAGVRLRTGAMTTPRPMDSTAAPRSIRGTSLAIARS